MSIIDLDDEAYVIFDANEHVVDVQIHKEDNVGGQSDKYLIKRSYAAKGGEVNDSYPDLASFLSNNTVKRSESAIDYSKMGNKFLLTDEFYL